jgi:hypothetical protein
VYKIAKPIKLKWYKSIDLTYANDAGIDIFDVWRTNYKDYQIVVFPSTFFNKNKKGWEYIIYHGDNDIYNSLAESNGQYSESCEDIKKWAKDKLEKILSMVKY